MHRRVITSKESQVSAVIWYRRNLLCMPSSLYLVFYQLQIERIQNQALYTQYAAKRKQMLQQNSHIKNNERELWHGTAADAVTSINHHGFNRSYCGKNGKKTQLLPLYFGTEHINCSKRFEKASLHFRTLCDHLIQFSHSNGCLIITYFTR